MAAGEVSAQQDGRLRLHPYLIALARWCVSYLWSSAPALLCRLVTSPLPLIMASKPPKPRPAGREHLHAEPRVECVVLHQPAAPRVDVVFVHGLYGSLGNTWRQGEWLSKYKIEPNKITLRQPSSIPCECDTQTDNTNTHNSNNRGQHTNSCNDKDFHMKKYITNTNEEQTFGIKMEPENILNFNDKEITFTNIDDYYKNRITHEEMFITEKFYEEGDHCEVIDNYETQARFVRDLFTLENLKDEKEEADVACRCRGERGRECGAGCGCVCDGCYSSCWPRDWIKVDYPDARVISVNYTSDPHLWRPLWIKESKRLQLHERAEQMMEQLVQLGVGERPIVWVGHSKGGLYIKQIYCEAYEAYMKLRRQTNEQKQNCDEYDIDNEMNHKTDNPIKTKETTDDNNRIDNNDEIINTGNMDVYESLHEDNFLNYNDVTSNDNSFKNILDEDRRSINDRLVSNHFNAEDDESKYTVHLSSNKKGVLTRRARVWRRSAAFMFYSVPHRGSPLADVRAPLTARSPELLEMGRDCWQVRRLHARWLRAAAAARPRVSSLVETRRTLMAVLWLRIVSVDSADAGIGALGGVSVDHREICKPSSRHCILYKELSALVHAALSKCQQ